MNSKLQYYFGDFSLELLKNEISNKDLQKHAARYSEAILQFSLTFYFYSPRNYKYAQTLFKLPHPKKTIGFIYQI